MPNPLGKDVSSPASADDILLPEVVLRAVAHLRPGARVVAAMSGGVDSSVVAAILKHAGFDVVGLTMQLYDHGKAVGRGGTCCAGQDIHDARSVAETLGIAHYVLDYETRFREQVIAPFIEAYAHGETPIPCVSCNSDMKFGDLLATAKSLGAEALATGHYVQRIAGADGAELHRGRDRDRDQSYFLFTTTRAQLDDVIFPLGGLEKSAVRELARAFGIPVADKADSQDICFVPTGRYTDVIQKLKPDAAEPGEIVHTDGRVLGRHDGIVHFTVGQRKGLGIATGEPLFVVRLDAARRQVVVGPRERLGVDIVELRDVNWLGGTVPADGLDVFVRTRSSQPLRRARYFVRDDGTAYVRLAVPEPGIAPGQAGVVYDGDDGEARVLGGGFIRSTRLGADEAGPSACESDRDGAKDPLKDASRHRKSATFGGVAP